MDKKGISSVLVDAMCAALIVLVIGVFFAAIVIKNAALESKITGNIKEKALTSVLLTYLDSKTVYKGSEVRHADLITLLSDENRLDELSADYFNDLASRTGYCVEQFSIYKGAKKLVTKTPSFCLQVHGDFFSDPVVLDRTSVVFPDRAGYLYQIEAVGYWVGS